MNHINSEYLPAERLFEKLSSIDFRNKFTHGDQPTTCPYCGARTEMLLDLGHTNQEYQIHICLSPTCNFTFIAEKDDFDYSQFKDEEDEDLDKENEI